MAKIKSASDQVGKVKLRVIEFEIEGSDTTIQESLKSITAALNRGTAGTLSATNRTKSLQSPIPPIDGPQKEDSDDGELEDDENIHEAEVIRKPAATKKPRPMKLLTEINFNDAAITLKDFASEKAPKSDMHRYLVIAHWFKHQKATSDLSPDHFFTAYRHLQWPVPTDPAGPIKDLRHKRRTQLSAGASHGTSTINHVGEEIVLTMGKNV